MLLNKLIDEMFNSPSFIYSSKNNKNLQTFNPPVTALEYLMDFLSFELYERVYVHNFSESLIFDEKQILSDPKSFFRDEKSNLEHTLKQASKQLNNSASKVIYQKNRLGALNVFYHELALYRINKLFCQAIIENLEEVVGSFDISYEQNSAKRKLLENDKKRNEILKQVFTTKEQFREFHGYRMQLKARIIKNVLTYKNNLKEVISDKDFSPKDRKTIWEAAKIKFPAIPSKTEFDRFSTYETEYLIGKERKIFGS